MGMFNRKKICKHKWDPRAINPVFANGKIFVVEYCEKCGMYQYVRVPSFKERMILDGGSE